MTLLEMATVVAMARWWWTFVLRGVVAIGIGVLAFFAPGWGLLVLVALFGVWALIEGVSTFFAGLRTRGANRNWWLEVLTGIVSIAAGVIALLFPGFASGILLILIAGWAIVIGVFQVYMAIRLRNEIRGEFWLGLAGVAAIIFGISMFLFPTAGILGLVWLIGSFAIAFGVFLVLLGWRLRRINELARRDAATDYSRA
jgi:uncharacterized membrane protein HdeD (DUF308 family)